MTNRRYTIGEESGATDTIEAASLDEALQAAKDWAADGDYDEQCMVEVWAEEDETGKRVYDDVMAGPQPEEPECTSDEHEWEAIHSLVGGMRENPGVWSLGGTRMSFDHVCIHCGHYRRVEHAGWQRNPGELSVKVSYRAPDEASRAYCRRQKE